jgi:phosphoglycerate dehydrogenase-like enzyme
MKKFKRIAVINVLNLPKFAEEALREYSDSQIIFPTEGSKSEEETIKIISDADAVLGSWDSTITPRILEACSNLKYIGICGTSLTKVDVEDVKKRSITLKNVVDYGDEATAEFIFSQLLSLFRGFGKYQWDDQPSELNGKTIGIVGLGAVGQQVARLALGFNMNVSYFSRTHNSEWETKGLIYKSLEDLLLSCDVISLNIPRNLTILTKKEFDLIKPKTVLVNTAIGSVFDFSSFVDWVKKGKNFAIFDNQEYIDQIKDLPNVIAPAVTAGKTKESADRLGQKVLDNIKSYLDL